MLGKVRLRCVRTGSGMFDFSLFRASSMAVLRNLIVKIGLLIAVIHAVLAYFDVADF